MLGTTHQLLIPEGFMSLISSARAAAAATVVGAAAFSFVQAGSVLAADLGGPQERPRTAAEVLKGDDLAPHLRRVTIETDCKGFRVDIPLAMEECLLVQSKMKGVVLDRRNAELKRDGVCLDEIKEFLLAKGPENAPKQASLIAGGVDVSRPCATAEKIPKVKAETTVTPSGG